MNFFLHEFLPLSSLIQLGVIMYEIREAQILNTVLPVVVVDKEEYLVGVQISNVIGKGAIVKSLKL